MAKTKTKTKSKKKYMPLYKCLLHNDDVHDMDTVIIAIMSVFKYDTAKACNIMMEAHKTGVALCKIEPLEHAELHVEQMQSFSLTMTLEPA